MAELVEQKSYSERKKGKIFDWNAFLNKDYHTHLELDKAMILAGDWVTCACGCQCDALPREADGEPEDRQLVYLGRQFSSVIVKMRSDYPANHSREEAKRLLNLIENRSRKLLDKKS